MSHRLPTTAKRHQVRERDRLFFHAEPCSRRQVRERDRLFFHAEPCSRTKFEKGTDCFSNRGSRLPELRLLELASAHEGPHRFYMAGADAVEDVVKEYRGIRVARNNFYLVAGSG